MTRAKNRSRHCILFCGTRQFCCAVIHLIEVFGGGLQRIQGNAGISGINAGRTRTVEIGGIRSKFYRQYCRRTHPPANGKFSGRIFLQEWLARKCLGVTLKSHSQNHSRQGKPCGNFIHHTYSAAMTASLTIVDRNQGGLTTPRLMVVTAVPPGFCAVIV